MDEDARAGFLAVSDGGDDAAVPATAVRSRHGAVTLSRWGGDATAREPVALLSPLLWRSGSGSVPPGAVRSAALADPRTAASRMMPPFALAVGHDDGVTAVTDAVGFRPVYAARGALASSALLAGAATAAALDERGIAVQSLVGWQLGDRTLLEGVRALPAGAAAELRGGGTRVDAPGEPAAPEWGLREGAARAAGILRATVERVLDEHPDATLQLSGGWDSRVLLSAVPPSRRRGLRAMTLGDEEDGDVKVARVLAARCGLRHEVRPQADFSGLSPERAWERLEAAARRVDGQTDALAVASLRRAEEGFEQGVRISGVAGEVGRGFFYGPRAAERGYERGEVERLAAWRLFANHRVEDEALTPDFRRWAAVVAVDEVEAALRAGGDEFLRASDRLYLRHRVRRWAGTNDAAVSDDRLIINPMLDPDFLAVMEGVAPAGKAHARFFAMLQMELDGDLADVPLDGRPSPRRQASRSPSAAVLRASLTARKGARKAVQRLRRGTRPAAGTHELARLVARHWADEPGILAPLEGLDSVLDGGWLADVADGRRVPLPSSVAFVTSLLMARSVSRRAGAVA